MVPNEVAAYTAGVYRPALARARCASSWDETGLLRMCFSLYSLEVLRPSDWPEDNVHGPTAVRAVFRSAVDALMTVFIGPDETPQEFWAEYAFRRLLYRLGKIREEPVPKLPVRPVPKLRGPRSLIFHARRLLERAAEKPTPPEYIAASVGLQEAAINADPQLRILAEMHRIRTALAGRSPPPRPTQAR